MADCEDDTLDGIFCESHREKCYAFLKEEKTDAREALVFSTPEALLQVFGVL